MVPTVHKLAVIAVTQAKMGDFPSFWGHIGLHMAMPRFHPLRGTTYAAVRVSMSQNTLLGL